MEGYISLDIGGTNIKHGFMDGGARIIEKNETPTESFLGGPHILRKVLSIVEGYMDKYQVNGVAISTAGMVNPVTGEIFEASPLIPDYTGINYKKEIESHFDLICEVENDVNCAGLAENISGASKGTHSSVMLTIGTGIGGCIIIDNHIHHGYSFSAGEVGYMRIDGGMYENRGAASILIKNVAAAKDEPVELWNGKRIIEGAALGDMICLREIDSLCDELSKGIANICYILNPEMVVLGGGIMAGKEYFEYGIKNYLQSYLVKNIRENTKITFAMHGNDAGMIGAYHNFRKKHK